MANYGYDGGYSTTSYGAQGGADGGGFLGGSEPGGSQETGSKAYGKDTLRPVTIKQVLEATQAHPDADFKLDGQEMTQITFVGQIRSISSQSLKTVYKLDDGTGLIEVTIWIDADAPPDPKKDALVENIYVRVYGRLKAFNNKRHVVVHVIRPVTDFNELNMHLLEATYSHLYFTRGPPESLQQNSDGNAMDTGGNSMFVDAPGHGNAGGLAAGKHMSPLARKVFNHLAAVPQNNEGLHAQVIAAQIGLPVNDVFKAGDELLGIGVIFTTVDDETWAVLDY